MKPLIPLLIIPLLTSCQTRVSDPLTGNPMYVCPNDATLVNYAGYDSAGRKHTLTMARHAPSVNQRALFKGLERVVGTVGPLVRPEAAAGALVPLLGRETP